MKPTFADFSVTPPRLSNAVVTYRACHAGAHHHSVDAGGSVRVDFEVEEREEIAEATLKVTALVSKLGSSMGFAPMSVLVNGEVVADRLTIAGGGDLPQNNVFAVPGRLLEPGANTLEIRSCDDARSTLRLYRITLDSVYQRDRSERALGAEADKLSVFAFSTERRTAGAGSWEPTPDLLLHLDRGEHAVPAQLSWRGTDGAEAAVSFAANMSGFHGYHRSPDGLPSEFRGSLTDRWAFPEGTANARVRRFSPEEGWGGGWHTSGELRFLLEDGGAPVERITWRDQRENSGSIVVRSAAPHDISNLVTGVRASREFAHAGEIAENLLDSGRTKWLAGARSATVDFTLARPVAVTSYALTTANDFPGRDPRDWTFQGSHDGASWTVLDSRTQEGFGGRFRTRDFSLADGTAATAFAHYRLAVTHNCGASEVQLGQVRLFAGGTSAAPSPYDFLGYYQRVNEGPIGYRGTAVHSAPVPADHLAPTEPVAATPVAAGPRQDAEPRPAAPTEPVASAPRQDPAPRPAAPTPEPQDPDDVLIVSRDLNGERPWLKVKPDEQVPHGRVVHTAALLGWTPAAVVERLTALGYADIQRAGGTVSGAIDPADAPLVKSMASDSYHAPWLDVTKPLSLRQVLEAACLANCGPAHAARRLTAFGYRLGGNGERPLPETPDPADVMLTLTGYRNYQDCLDWGDEVREHHVFHVARAVTRRPRAVATRLIELGFRLPADILDRTAERVHHRPDVPADVPEADGDLVILSEELDGRAPWLVKNTTVGLQIRHILRAALATGRSPADIARRLAELGHRPHDNASLPAVADGTDISLLETVDRSYLDNVHLEHVLRSASLTGRSPADVAARLTALGYRLPDDVEYPGIRGTPVTV